MTATTLPVDFHSTRRAYATALARVGVNEQTAMALTGHASSDVHKRYLEGLRVRALPSAFVAGVLGSSGYIAALALAAGGGEVGGWAMLAILFHLTAIPLLVAGPLFFVVGPVAALERRSGFAPLGRSLQLSRGQRVFLMMNSANRDPRAFADPDRLDLRRRGVPHLTFGFGAHLCLGFPLARLEGQIALPAVLRRWRSMEIRAQRLDWIDSMVLRGMQAMPLGVRH